MMHTNSKHAPANFPRLDRVARSQRRVMTKTVLVSFISFAAPVIALVAGVTGGRWP